MENAGTYVRNLTVDDLKVKYAIQHIFQDLSAPQLLGKCLHGKTQNNNEALNSFIWNRLPKDIFVGPYVLEMDVCSAVLDFNSGYRSLLEISEKLCMNSGHCTTAYCVKKDTTRIHQMERKMSTEGNMTVNINVQYGKGFKTTTRRQRVKYMKVYSFEHSKPPIMLSI